MQVILRPAFPNHFFELLWSGSRTSPEEIQRLKIEQQVRRDLGALRTRARQRRYPDTARVLTYYWVQTLRESYTPEHWAVLKNAVKRVRPEATEGAEPMALERAAEWIQATHPLAIPQRRRENLAPPFTSEYLAPPSPAMQIFLERLLNQWLPERILQRFGAPEGSPGWSVDRSYEEIALCLEDILRPQATFPDFKTVQALNRIQKRRQPSREDLGRWIRRRQARLESMLRIALPDASVADPKIREILNDVVLYLMGVTDPPPVPEAGYAWLFPTPLSPYVPADLGTQVSQFGLPRDYESADTLTIPLTSWNAPGRPDDRMRVSIRSTLLTPDGRVWDAYRLEHRAGSGPAIGYRVTGRIDLRPEPGGLSLRVPLATWPEEVNPQLSHALEFDLYNQRWHMHSIQGSPGDALALYKTVTKFQDNRWTWPQAS